MVIASSLCFDKFDDCEYSGLIFCAILINYFVKFINKCNYFIGISLLLDMNKKFEKEKCVPSENRLLDYNFFFDIKIKIENDNFRRLNGLNQHTHIHIY